MLAKSGFNKLGDYVKHKRKVYGEIYFNRFDLKYEDDNLPKKISAFFTNPPDKIGEYSVLSFREFYNSRGEVNGLKFTFEGTTRWLLIKTSETENVIRIYAEGKSNSEVESIISAGKNLFA